MSATQSSTRRELLSRSEAAQYLGNIAPQTLANWASRGAPRLKYIRVGRRALYDRAELDRFLTENTFTSAAEARR